MSRHLQNDLTYLEQELLAQSSMVEDMIRKSSKGLRQVRGDFAVEVIACEPEVNRREIRIEEECLKILALHQPVAVDLRRVTTVLKVNGELERIADLAVNISERTQSLTNFPDFPVPNKMDDMAKLATSMVHAALDALVSQDVKAARLVCEQDDEVDEYNVEMIRDLRDMMRARTEFVEPALHFFSASRQIERIADHATNIAEDVVYLVEGEILRHPGLSKESQNG